MSTAPVLAMQLADWLALFGHYLSLSLLSIGGAITLVPEMHRFLVDQQHWLSAVQFNDSIAIAQAAPGPNMLFVALLGWNVGMNAGGVATALLGALVALSGILLPSTTLVCLAARWGQRNRDLPALRAFKQGMGPIVIALMIATGWVLASSHPATSWRLWLLTAAVTLIVVRSKIHLLWLLGAGALLGAFGVV